MFALVAQAFEILSDPERRSAYDRGVVEGKTHREKPPLAFEGFDFAAAGGGRQGFRELFEAAIEPEGESSQRGEDLEVTLRISFDEAFRGAHRRISVTRLSPCGRCDGTGHVARVAESCSTCGGEGSIRVRRGHLVFRARCRDCDGAGQRVQGPCPTCDGESRVHETEWMDINVPPGIEHGTRLRLPAVVTRVAAEERRASSSCTSRWIRILFIDGPATISTSTRRFRSSTPRWEATSP